MFDALRPLPSDETMKCCAFAVETVCKLEFSSAEWKDTHGV